MQAQEQQRTEEHVDLASYYRTGTKLVDSPSASRTPSQSRTRTYAGKSRSFLMAVSVDSLVGKQEPNTDILGVTLTDTDREAIRESYSELRHRWGVDNNEVCLYMLIFFLL